MVTDKVYASAGSSDLRYDAILAQGTPCPAIVCIHGGGWVSGDRSDMHDVAQFFAARGFAAFCPQYRLAPLYGYPAPLDDIATFMQYLRQNAEELNILAGSVGVIGNSAGGYLAAMAGLATNAESRANAVVDICGLTDLTNFKEAHPPISWDFILQYMSGASADDPKWIEASPLFRVNAQVSPFLIFHGEEDDVVYIDQSERLFEALKQAGVPVEIVRLAGEGHSFTMPAFTRILEMSTEFLKDKLGVAV